jgi:hypothetical protein
VKADGPVPEGDRYGYRSFGLVDALRMDVQNRANHCLEVQGTIPYAATLLRGDPSL